MCNINFVNIICFYEETSSVSLTCVKYGITEDELKRMLELKGDILSKFAVERIISPYLTQIFKEVYDSIPLDSTDSDFYRGIEDSQLDCIDEAKLSTYLSTDNMNKREPSRNAIGDVGKYIFNIVENVGVGAREKIPVILSHMESFIIESCSIQKSGDRLTYKNAESDLQMELVDNAAIKMKRLTYCYRVQMLWIYKALFLSVFDIKKHKVPFPFRDYILHNGTLDYSDDDIEEMYKILVQVVEVISLIGPRLNLKFDAKE